VTVTVRIPGPLRPYCDGRDRLDVEGASTVEAAIAALPAGVRERILDEQGKVRQHVNVFVGASDIRGTGGLETSLMDGDSLFVIPAVSGGSDGHESRSPAAAASPRTPRRQRGRGLSRPSSVSSASRTLACPGELMRFSSSYGSCSRS
jgi:sulfur-carrier protein